MKEASWVIFFILNFSIVFNLWANPPCSRWNSENLIYASKTSFEEALNLSHPGQRITKVRQGLKWAEGCVKSFPDEEGCHYYRAILGALALEQNLLGYQKALKKIVADLDFVIQKKAAYDEAGALRIKGFIYLKAPQFSLKKKAVIRDLDLADDLASKALALYPKNRDNRFLKACVLFEKNQYIEAQALLIPLKKEYKSIKPLNHQEVKDLKEIEDKLNKISKLKSKH
ncbi:MAG: hypothetical protein ACD_73C00191G0001 [uncultured bacterium]|nr:MAG: hypothetical protein ACD_73C00191G0001 [uncultured bacterium]